MCVFVPWIILIAESVKVELNVHYIRLTNQDRFFSKGTMISFYLSFYLILSFYRIHDIHDVMFYTEKAQFLPEMAILRKKKFIQICYYWQKPECFSMKHYVMNIMNTLSAPFTPALITPQLIVFHFQPGPNLIQTPNAGPYYASDEKITPIRAGVKRADKVVTTF